MNSNSHTLTRGNKQFELCNHLGNVLVTVQDRKRSVDVNADNQADYYLPYLRTVTNYYAYGSAMPGIGGSIKECTVTSTNLTLKKYPYFYTFSNDSTSGFTAGSGARSVTNPTHNVLHIESIWTTRPLANKSLYLKNGVTYDLKFNIAGFSVVSGYTHTVKVRILLPGSTLSYSYTATGNQTINFTCNTTGYITIEISSQITGSGTYGINPYIDIDNFNLSWDSSYTAYVNTCNTDPDKYKYGFNNQEQAQEFGDFYSFEYRMHDARLGRWLSVDPHKGNYHSLSTYSSFANNPILIIDPDGRDIIINLSSTSNYIAVTCINQYYSVRYSIYTTTKPVLVLKSDIKCELTLKGNELPIDIYRTLDQMKSPITLESPLNKSDLEKTLDANKSESSDAAGINIGLTGVLVGGITFSFEFIKIQNSSDPNQVGDWNAYFNLGAGIGAFAGGGVSIVQYNYLEDNSSDPLTASTFTGVSWATNYGAYFISASDIVSYGEGGDNIYVDPANWVNNGDKKPIYTGESFSYDQSGLSPFDLGFCRTMTTTWRIGNAPIIEGDNKTENTEKPNFSNVKNIRPIVASSQYDD